METPSDYEFIIYKVIPALSTFSRNGEVDKYLDLIKCTDINSILYSSRFYANNQMNLLKQEAKFEYEMVHLLFTRTHLPEQWSELFFKKISSDNNLINIATQLPDSISKLLKADKNHQINELKNEIIFALEDEIKYASKQCDSFSEDQLLMYNNFILSLAEAQPYLHAFHCN